jgi:hypothetical protein
VGLTPFYAIDQESLPEPYWGLADTFAELHALSADEPDGVHRLTVADLRILLACARPRTREEDAALTRVIAAIGGLPSDAGDAVR